jgi:hypothetical protein
MLPTILAEITTYLEAQTIVSRGTNAFEGYEPDYAATSDLSYWDVCVYKGAAGQPSLASGLDYSRVKIVARAEKHDVAYAKAYEIFSYLHGLNNMVLSERRYVLIKAIQDPTDVGSDVPGLFQYVCNYECMVENNTVWRS